MASSTPGRYPRVSPLVLLAPKHLAEGSHDLVNGPARPEYVFRSAFLDDKERVKA